MVERLSRMCEAVGLISNPGKEGRKEGRKERNNGCLMMVFLMNGAEWIEVPCRKKSISTSYPYLEAKVRWIVNLNMKGKAMLFLTIPYRKKIQETLYDFGVS